MPQPTKEKWLQIAQDFYKHANIPSCLGATDKKNICIIKPQQSGSLFYNYKNFFQLFMILTTALHQWTLVVLEKVWIHLFFKALPSGR
jgi:hypothetical protein